MNKAITGICLLSFLFVSCSRGYQQFVSSYTFKSPDGKPDYSNLDYWAAHPDKKDPSDSLPKPLVKDFVPDTSADVFFIYPTSYGDASYTLGYNAPIDNALINAKTDYSSILYQASVFNAAGRIFAPRYRQANYWYYFSKDTARAKEAFDFAYDDVKLAFEYYLEHSNRGRPIIIGAHSQGTTHALKLLKEFFDQSPLKEKLVAAYLVGMYIPENYFSNLTICKDPSQINCFCGWRTYRVNYIPPYVEKETIKSCVTNPLTWNDSVKLATADLNKGAILRKFNRVYYNVSDAKVNEGIVWTKKPKFPGSFMLRTKNYHIGDINLYYYSIRENIHQRVTAYKKN